MSRHRRRQNPLGIRAASERAKAGTGRAETVRSDGERAAQTRHVAGKPTPPVVSNPRIARFSTIEHALRCPLCGSPVALSGTSMRCVQGHALDVSARGYVNFLPHQKPFKGYDRVFFQHRRALMEQGLYAHVIETVVDLLDRHLPHAKTPPLVVDAGCGEGSYARAAADRLGARVVAFDAAKDALHVAAGGGVSESVFWAVGDVARIPVASDMADAVLNAFTPANYREFARILKPGGVLVKIIPGAEHMREVRHAARDLIGSEAYSNKPVADYFDAHFSRVASRRARAAVELDAEQAREVLRMTPVLFNASEEELMRIELARVTVDAEVLVGVQPCA